MNNGGYQTICLLDVIIYNDFIPGCLQNITIHLILK